MKILIAGSDEVWSLERHYYKYLKLHGADVYTCPVQSIFLEYYNKSILNKLLFKSGLSLINNRIEKIVRETVLEIKPDVLWAFKGMELTPALLKWIKGQGIKLVNYNPDNPFIFSGKGSGNKNVTDSIGLYDLYLSYDRDICKQLETQYQVRTGLLPFGFELSEDLFQECEQQPEVVKACFLGNPDADRARFINSLAEQNVCIDVYGHGWANFVNNQAITVYAPAYGKEFWKTLRKYRVQLNLMRIHNPNSHNMRSFEVPGVGGIGLYPDTIDHRTYFTDKQDIFLYRNGKECASVLHEILSLSTEAANAIRESARLNSLSKGYSYEQRSKQVLQQMKQLF